MNSRPLSLAALTVLEVPCVQLQAQGVSAQERAQLAIDKTRALLRQL